MGKTKITEADIIDIVKDSIFLTTEQVAEEYSITSRYVTDILKKNAELRKEMLDAYIKNVVNGIRLTGRQKEC